MTKYGVNTLFQSDTPSNTIPSGNAGYNSSERIEFAKGWIDDAAGMGSQVIRYPGDWIGLEGGGKGQFSVEYVAEAVSVIDYAASKGIEVIYEFGQTPPWARPVGIDAGNFTPPENPQDYADAVAYLHSQFVAAGVADNISGWEIWNEPNANLGWPTAAYRNPLSQNQGIDPAVDKAAALEYVKLLNLAYEALKDVDASVTVLGGSLAGTDFEYLSWMLEADAKFDGLAVHPYTRNFDNANFLASQSTAPARPKDDPTAFPEGFGLSDTLNERFSFEYGLNELRALLDANDRGDTNLYLTEMGWGVGEQGTLTVGSFEIQAEYLLEALEVVRDFGSVEAVTIFQLYDFTDGAVGLLDDDGNSRPGANVLRNFIEQNGAAELLDRGTTESIFNTLLALETVDQTINEPGDGVAPEPLGLRSGIIVNGTSNGEVLASTAADDFIRAGAGDDIIIADAGNDTIVGDLDNGTSDYDRLDYTGTESRRADFVFTPNADGSITATSDAFDVDLLYGIDAIFFEADDVVIDIDDLF